MSIWKEGVTAERINELSKTTMVDHLDIKIVEVGEDYLKATMPVDKRTVQPMRLLHGGASVALAETIGSIASVIIKTKTENKGAVGISINANHVKSAHEGEYVYGIATPISIGRSIHVWDIKIYNPKDELCCISRLTTKVLK